MSLREQFDTHGWAVARGVVSGDELARFRGVFGQLVPELEYPRREGDDGVVWEVTGAAPAVPRLARLAHDPRFAALVAAALGCAEVQLLQDSLLYKPAREGGRVAWHQDHTYVGFVVPARVVSLRLALVDEDESSGCLRVVDGSHRWGPVGGMSALSAEKVDSLLPSLSDEQRAALASARPIELAAGDVSIHHCLTLHGSEPNRADRPRKTLILRMFDGACRLDPARLPEATRGHFPIEPDGRLARSAFPLLFGGAR